MSTLTLPFAALGALLGALLETSVAPELTFGGAQVDLILSMAVVAAIVMGIEDGLVWAFVGGLMIDMLIPGRPIGATTLALLLSVGAAALLARAPGPRRTLALASVFALTWLFHALLLGIMTVTEGIALRSFAPTIVIAAAVLNAIVAIPATMLFGVVQRRLGSTERAAW